MLPPYDSIALTRQSPNWDEVREQGSNRGRTMAMTVDVIDIFGDARHMHSSALEQWEQVDIRDAAEKAWCATVRATQALVLARTGIMPVTSTQTRIQLDILADSDSRFKTLIGRYYTRQTSLHGDCFYLGLCEPLQTIERRVRETADYIRDAEGLAALPSIGPGAP